VTRADSDADNLSPSGQRDVFDRLIKDHRTVQGLFDQIQMQMEDDPEVARGLFAEVRLQLLAHAHAEDQVVYAAFEEIDELSDFVHEGREEHALVEKLIDELASMLHVDDTWQAKIKVLAEMVAHHVEEEEQDAFPKARRAFGDEAARELGEQFRRAKTDEIDDEPSQGIEQPQSSH
jgi:hemerythrin superfamily protein